MTLKLEEIKRRTPAKDVIPALKHYGACSKAIKWIKEDIKSGKAKTAQDLWNLCPDGDWLLWLVEMIDDFPNETSLWDFYDLSDEIFYEYGWKCEVEFADAIRKEYESPWLP